MKISKSLDFIAVPLSFLEKNVDISNKNLGAAVRAVSYLYKHPEEGNRLNGAKGWSSAMWAVNCAGLKPAAVKTDVDGLWHWEGDSLIIDCFLEGVKKALEKRKAQSNNAQKRWGRSGDKEKTDMPWHCQSAASDKYEEEDTSTRESTRGSTRGRESTSYRQKKEDENILSGRDEQKEREAIRQSVEETKHKQSVEGSDKQATTDEALKISKTEDFKQWAEKFHNVRTVDSLRTSELGIRRIVELVRDYCSSNDNSTAPPDDDIPF